jgi:uncharacterized protein YrrD
MEDSMRLIKGEDVYSAQGDKLGKLERVIVDPETNEVTHLVIGKGLLFKTSKVVGMDQVDTSQDRINLHGSQQELEELTDFEEAHYVNLDQDDYPAAQEVEASYLYPPINVTGWQGGGLGVYGPYPGAPTYVLRTSQNIPEGTVALEEGAKVISSDDKHVGNIVQVVVGPENNQITHFVVDEGMLFKARRLIPVRWISEIDEDKVHLSVTARVLDRLPAYQPVK